MIALFRRFAAGQRKSFWAAGLLLSLETAASLGVPNLLGNVVDFLKDEKVPGWVKALWFTPSHDETILVFAAVLVIFESLSSLSDSLAEISLAKVGRSVGYNLRVALFGHLQKLSLAFHLRRRTGDVLTRITGDVTALEEFMLKSVSDLAGSVLLIIGTLAVLFWKSVPVALLAIVIVPILASVSNTFARRIKTASKTVRAREGDLASAAQEMLTSVGVVQTYGRSGYEEARFAEQNRSAMEAVMRTARLDAAFSFTISVLQSLVLAAVIWLGAVALGTSLSPGTLVTCLLVIDQMFKPTKRIIKEWNTVSKVYASVERINDLLDREPAVQDAPDAFEAPPLTGEVEFDDVSFAYQPGPDEDTDEEAPRLALDAMSFVVGAGEVVALVGHSGAGKSTIAQLVPRLYDPHRGAVLVDGYDVRDMTIDSLRRQISMVLQETMLFSGTVAENIAYGREGATQDDVIAAAKLANAHDFITAMPRGYETELGERAGTLSGGQRQRLAIARAFIRDAPILILDEPTTGLDAESSELVLQALEKLVRGKTALIISHDLNLMRIADRLLVVSAGRIMEEGTAEDLLARGGLYAQLYAHQFGVAAMVEAQPQATPVPTSRQSLDEDEPAPVSRRAFETVLMQALPLPATREAFQQLTGYQPTPYAGGRPGPDTAMPEPAGESAGRHAAPEAPATPRVGNIGLDADEAAALARSLPGLSEALDADAMAPRLAAMLGDGWALEWSSPGKALIDIGDGGTLRYRLGLRDTASGRVVEHIVGGRLFRDADAAELCTSHALAPLSERVGNRSDLAPFRRYVQLDRALGLVLHAFPIDPDLPGLLDATDAATLPVTLAPAVSNPVEGLSLDECRPHLVQYARRGRCVLRYDVMWLMAGTGRRVKQVLYGKAYADDSGELVERAAAAIRTHVESGSDPAGKFLVPRARGYLPQLRLSLLEAIPGTPQVVPLLRQRAGQTGSDGRGPLTLGAALAACARISATVHSCPEPQERTRTWAGELDEVRTDVAALRHYAPRLAEDLGRRLDTLERSAPPAMPPAFAHGDFTPAQILFDGPVSGLIDLDTTCLAEPALDLGQFLGYLDLAAHKAAGGSTASAADREELADQFLGSYARAAQLGPNDGLRERVACYRTLTVVRVAARSWRQLKGRRVQVALAVLDDLERQPSAQAVGI